MTPTRFFPEASSHNGSGVISVGAPEVKPFLSMSLSSDRSGRVLLLEIDYSNRILFTDYLEHCGYSVLPLEDEQTVFDSVESFQPHVLILNLKMPVIDGYTVIEKLRHDPRWKSLAILVVSGYTLIRDRQKAYAAGANAYLTKPVIPHDLSNAVAQLMQQQVAVSESSSA